MATDNKRLLYDALIEEYDLGSYEEFCADLDDRKKRRELYETIIWNYDIGSWDSFSQLLGYEPKSAGQKDADVVVFHRDKSAGPDAGKVGRAVSAPGVGSTASVVRPLKHLKKDVPETPKPKVANPAPKAAAVPGTTAGGVRQIAADSLKGTSDRDSVNRVLSALPSFQDGLDASDRSDVAEDGAGQEENGLVYDRAGLTDLLFAGSAAASGRINDAVESAQRLSRASTPEGRRAAEQARMNARMMGVPTELPGIMKRPDREGQASESGGASEGVAPTGRPRVHGVRSVDGEMVTEWMLPDGSVTTDLAEADAAEYEGRRAEQQKQFVERMYENGLNPADEEDVKLQAEFDDYDVSQASQEGNDPQSWIKRQKVVTADGKTYDLGTWHGHAMIKKRRDESAEYNEVLRKRSVARENEILGMLANAEGDKEEYELLQDALKEQRERTRKLQENVAVANGEGQGFWGALGDTVFDWDNWLSGALSFLRSRKRRKLADISKSGCWMSPAERTLLDAMEENENTFENKTAWARYGEMAGESLHFMKDFLLTGLIFGRALSIGAKAVTSLSGKAGRGYLRVAAKAAGGRVGAGAASVQEAQALRAAAMNGAKNTAVAVKVLGRTAEDVARGTLTMFVPQFASTTSRLTDAIDGRLVRGEDGHARFEREHGVFGSLWHEGMDILIENWSENVGARFGVLGLGKLQAKVARKLAGAIGPGRVSDFILQASSRDLLSAGGKARKLFETMGISDYVGEVGEEYAGQIARSILGLDSAYTVDEYGNRVNNLQTGDFHTDIWLGMFLTMGLTNSLKGGATAYNYSQMRRGLGRADRAAGAVFGEGWKLVRQAIDGATNDKIGAVLTGELKKEGLTQQQREALTRYAVELMQMRGFGLGQLARERNGMVSKEENTKAIWDMLGRSIGNRAEAVDALRRYHVADARVRDAFDLGLDRSPWEPLGLRYGTADVVELLSRVQSDKKLSDYQRRAVMSFLESDAIIDGLQSHHMEMAEEEVADVRARYERMKHKESGDLQRVILRNDGREVYVTGGTVVVDDRGMIDTDASEQTLTVFDAKTGEAEMVSPQDISEVFAPEAMEAARDAEIAELRDAAYDEFATMSEDAAIAARAELERESRAAASDASDSSDGSDARTMRSPIDGVGHEQKEDSDELRPGKKVRLRGADGSVVDATLSYYDGNDWVVETGDELVQLEGEDRGYAVRALSEDVLRSIMADVPRATAENAEPVVTDQPEAVPGPEVTTVPGPEQPSQGEAAVPDTALARIPVDEQGRPMYDEADADTVWDAIVEQAQGDEATAAEVVADIVAERQDDFKAAEKALARVMEGKPEKRKKGSPAPTMEERIAAKNAAKEALAEAQAVRDRAKAALDHWSMIAGTKQRRESERIAAEEAEARRLAAERAEAEKAEREAREEAARLERGAGITSDSSRETEGEPDSARRIAERHAEIEKHLGTKYSFSQEQANHGEVFYQNEQGTTNLAVIPDEIFDKIGVDPIPFKLTETMAWHVYTNHAKELGLKNLDDAIDFVLDIVNNVDHVRLGKGNTFIFSVENTRRGVAHRAITIVVKADTGEFMGIKTSGFDRMSSLEKRPILWESGAVSTPEAIATPTVTTIKAQQGDKHMGRAEGQSVGEISERKVTNSASDKQERGANTTAPATNKYDRTIPSTLDAQRGAIARIVDFAKNVKDRVERAIIGGITKRQAKDFADQGIDIDETWVHSFESSAVGHNQKRHGDVAKEDRLGQIAVTESDYARIPEILESYDRVFKSPNRSRSTGNEVVIYEKDFEDGYVYYLEEKRDKRKSLSFQTMYKKKKGTDSSDGLMPAASPSTSMTPSDNLSSNTERKDTDSASDKQANGAENADSPGDVAGAAVGAERAGAAESSEIIGRPLTEQEAADIIAKMESGAVVAPSMELTIENWDAQFGESGIVGTPIGDVKMGENQFAKLMRQGRNGKLGMIKPTLENPDIIIEDASEAKESDTTERKSSYVFVKTFVKSDGSRYYYFTSVTVSKDGHEVVVSNQEKRRNVLMHLLKKGRLVWKHADDVSSASDVADGLYSSQGNMSDPASEGTDAPQTNPLFSERKDTDSSSDKQEGGEKSSLGERVKAAEAEVNTDPVEVKLMEFAAKFRDLGAGGMSSIEREMTEWLSGLSAESLVDLNAEMLGRVCSAAGLDKGMAWAFRMLIDKATPQKMIQEVFELRNKRSREGAPSASASALEQKENDDGVREEASVLGVNAKSPERGGEATETIADTQPLSLEDMRLAIEASATADAELADKEADQALARFEADRASANDIDAATKAYDELRAEIEEKVTPSKEMIQAERDAIAAGYTTEIGTDEQQETEGQSRNWEGESDEPVFSIDDRAEGNKVAYDAAKGLVETAGIEVVEVSDAEARAMLDGRGDARLMGSRTDKKMAKVSEHYNDRELDANTQAVVDVFSGKADNIAIEVERADGKRRVIMRQGREPKAGTKHALYRHFETRSNYITADDIAMIPEIIAKGERSVNGKKVTYDYLTEDGTRLRVTTEVHGTKEQFTNLLSNRKPLQEKSVENTQSAHRSNTEVSDAKLENNSRTDKSEGEPLTLSTSDGTVYGWTVNRKIYLNRDAMNPETPLHEYTHLWDKMVQKENPELWERGKELMKQTPLWEEVMNDPNYADIQDDEDAVASEVHSRLTGKRGAERIEKMVKEAAGEPDMVEKAKRFSLIHQVKRWLGDMFRGLKKTLSKWSKQDLGDLTIEGFVDMTLRDLAEGVNPKSGEKDLVAIHNISEENLRKALDLGGFPMPSIAITKAGNGHTGFGGISLVFGKESVNPAGRHNKVYSGDAWTPTFPETGYKLNDAKTSRIYDRANKAGRLPYFRAVDFHPDNYERKINGDSRSLIDAFREDYGAKQLFLSEHGNAVERFETHEVEKYTTDEIGLFERMLEQIGVERLRNEGEEALFPELSQLISAYKGTDLGSMKPFVARRMVKNAIMKAVDYADNGNLKTETDHGATRAKIDERINPEKYEAWLEDMFAGVVEKTGIRNERDMFTPSGESRSWELLYDAVTLDNVVKAMRRQADKGGKGFLGGSIFGAAHRELRDMEEIRREAAERIRSVYDEEIETEKKRLEERLEKISLPSVEGSFSASMDFVENVREAVVKSHTPEGIYRYLSDIYPDMTMDVAKEISDIVGEIQKMSTRYLEAKPQRAVKLEEVRLAVVPEGTPDEIVRSLESRGIAVRTYERGNEHQRNAIISRETSERDLRFHAAMSRGRADFDAIRERAVAERGIVMPGLNEAEVRVVDVPRHDFKGTGKEALKAAEDWAKTHIVGTHTAIDSNGSEFEYSISNDAVEKYVSRSATAKSENIGVHLAVLKKLPEIIGESIEAEVHPSYNKGYAGLRGVENGYNSNALTHRFYGAARIDGRLYRIKTTIIEENLDHPNTAHSYEVAKIEVLAEKTNTSDDASPSQYERVRTAKLLQGVEKSYDPGVKILEASKNAVAEAPGQEQKNDGFERMGDGYGAYSDAEVSFANDPVSKVMGKNRFSKKRQAEFISSSLDELKVAARERQRMVDRIKGLAERMHLDNVEIVTDASQLEGKRAKAKGFYNKRAGKITIVIPNNVSTIDAEQTLLHEAVAHYGLRQLFGEQFDTFLDNVFDAADESIRRKINEVAAKNGWDFRTATEEYLAGLAENTNFEEARSYGGWWSKIKQLFLNMVEKIGFEGFRDNVGVVLTDNELRYILWRSYENLAEPGRHRSIIGEAMDVAMQSDLQVGNYAVGGIEAEYAAEPSETDAINERFNRELQQQIDGILPEGHVYDLGMPSKYLQSTGIENLPIRLSAKVLNTKSTLDRHLYSLDAIKNLVNAIQKPWAIFAYGDKTKAQNLIIGIEDNGRQFLVGLSINPTVKGRTLEIVSVRNVFPKNNHEWLNWINEGKLLRVDGKKEIQAVIAKLRMNPVAFDYLNLDDVAKIVENFENPAINEQNNNGTTAETVRAAGKEDGDSVAETEYVAESGRVGDKTINNVIVEESEAPATREEALGLLSRLSQPFRNDDQRVDIYVSKSNARHSMSFRSDAQIKAIGGIRQIIKGSVKIGEIDPTDDEKASTKKVHIYYCPVNIAGVQYSARMVVKEYYQGDKVLDQLNLYNYQLREMASDAPSHSQMLPAYPSKAKERYKVSELIHKTQENDAKLLEEADDDEILFRSATDYIERNRALARQLYERSTASQAYIFREAYQDCLLGLRRLYESVEKATGAKRRVEEVSSYENAYTSAVELSSRDLAEQTAYERLIMKPLLGHIARMSKNSKGQRKLIDYMMAKHGLERNVYMRQKTAEWNAKLAADQAAGERKKERARLTGRDFAGLTGLTGKGDWRSAEAEARKMVSEYEAEHGKSDIDKLWDLVNQSTKATLTKMLETGLISKEKHDDIAGMYKYYIPLRGWDETTTSDVYAYLTGKDGGLSGPIKKAEGRNSKADDPLAAIFVMMQSAIQQGNRNKAKERLLFYAMNHPSDLMSVSRVWLEYNDVDQEWVAKWADIDVKDSPEEAAAKVRDFEERMEQLRKQDPKRYKLSHEAPDVPYRIAEKQQQKEHQVIVKRGGVMQVITINGSPRAAQAINGITNPDNPTTGIGVYLSGLMAVNRGLSSMYTTRNPEFVLSNFARDGLYAITTAPVKEGVKYGVRYYANYGIAFANIARLMGCFSRNELDMSKPIERMFHEFMMNGGETGYTNARNIERQKKENERVIRQSRRGKYNALRLLGVLGDKLDYVNRNVENVARFATYMTSREVGRDIQRSVYDAKEITVNFNKKGAGSKFINDPNVSWWLKLILPFSDLGRANFVFWNAAIQGTTNHLSLFNRNFAGATLASAMFFGLGALMSWIGLGGDDDDNAYHDQPESTRRSNIMFKVGKYFGKIPLGVEQRIYYGLGELAMSVCSGKEKYSGPELAREVASIMSQALPLDFMDGGGVIHAVTPSYAKPAVEAWTNTSWTGLPIYRENERNEDAPEWTKAYEKTNKHIVALCKTLNEISGGTHRQAEHINLNPAIIEHLLRGYFGGPATMVDKTVKTAEMLAGMRETDIRNIPFVSRFVAKGDERTANRRMTSQFFDYKEECEKTSKLLKGYTFDVNDGLTDMAERVSAIYDGEAFLRYEIFEMFKGDLKAYDDVIKDEPDEAMCRELEAERDSIRRNLVSALDEPELYLESHGIEVDSLRKQRADQIAKAYASREKRRQNSRKKLEGIRK